MFKGLKKRQQRGVPSPHMTFDENRQLRNKEESKWRNRADDLAHLGMGNSNERMYKTGVSCQCAQKRNKKTKNADANAYSGESESQGVRPVTRYRRY